MTKESGTKKIQSSAPATRRPKSVKVEKPDLPNLVDVFEQPTLVPPSIPEPVKQVPVKSQKPSQDKPQAADKPANVQTRLREAREAKNLTLEECAKYLCIRRAQLEMIEEGKFKELPSVAHGIGFIRSYAEFLGLPVDKLVEQYRRESRIVSDQPDLYFPVALNDSRVPSKKIIIGSLFCLMALIATWNWYAKKTGSASAVDTVETAPTETAATTEVANSAPPVNPIETSPDADIPPAPTPSPVKTGTTYGDATSRVELYAEQDTWMQVRNETSDAIFSRVLRAGDSYRVPAQSGLTLTVGNAGGLKIRLDGTQLQTLGGTGQIIKNIPLDPDALKNSKIMPAQ